MIAFAPHFLIGLDLGERRDYTALTVMQQHVLPGSRVAQYLADQDSPASAPARPQPATVHQFRYDLIELQRWRGEGYGVASDRLRQVARQLRDLGYQQQRDQQTYPYREHAPVITIVVDHTGVGVAVVEELRRSGIECIGVTITAGTTVNQERNDYRVPKRELVARMQVLLETDRLKIAGRLPLASTLVAELDNFKAKKTLAGNDTYGAGEDWRDGNHDDLVLATAIAGWYGEHHAENWLGLQPLERYLHRKRLGVR